MKHIVYICLLAALSLGVVRLAPFHLRGQAAERGRTDASAGADSVSVQLARGLKLSLWASDPMLASPVAVSFDHQGRAYVVQTNRRKSSNLDIREHRDWMVEDLSLQTVEDKRRFLHTVLDPARSSMNGWIEDHNGDGLHDWRDLTVERELVHRLADTNGDGVADQANVFAEGFNTEVSGVAAGVLPHDGAVFVAVAPDLWRLRDTNGDGRADEHESVSHGYGVHFGFAGHDMSGLTLGPDGKIYWSIGDIGLQVEGPDGRRWVYPNHGAVMRSNPDGSDFEVFAHGLRNPQELAFDEHGNLFSVDNDGDRRGEHERVVYIVEGSDSGWRINWQFGKYDLPDNSSYNVWMEEQLYKPHFEGQAAYITPPVAPAHDGPAGFAYNPGTALGEPWQGYFFASYFTGTTARSHVNAFRVREKGASFELVDEQQVLKGLQITGISFGPDGALYLADWLEGWDVKDQGRIWRLDVADAPQRAETRTLLAEGMGARSVDALGRLLQHPDMRVRMEAQFELVRRGEAGAAQLLETARGSDHRLARLHGIWGIGQLGRQHAGAVAPLLALLHDGDVEVRAQAAKVVGEARYEAAVEALLPLLKETPARVRFFAAEALGKLEDARAVEPIIEMLAADAGADPYLRHAGALALARIGDAEALVGLSGHAAQPVRLAAVVALRRLQHPGVAAFLEDTDELVVTEAARAIHDDFSIEPALPALARLLDREGLTQEPLLLRAVNANLRLGRAGDARRLAQFAARSSAPAALRAEALAALGGWARPPLLDRVDGRYRPLGPRDPALAQAAVEPVVAALLTAAPAPVRLAAAETLGKLHYHAAGAFLLEMLADAAQPARLRTAALRALAEMRHDRLVESVRLALEDGDKPVRMEAQRLMATIDLPDEEVVEMLSTVLQHGSVEEQQAAFTALAALETEQADTLLSTWMDRLLAGTAPAEVQLDLLLAAEQSRSEEVAAKVAAYQASKQPDDPLAPFIETLAGGDAEAGRRIVFEHTTAQCVRCHQVDGHGGQVAPDLAGVGARSSRRMLLQSLVDPSAEIAPGYGTVVLTLKNGETVAGILSEETSTHVDVETGGGDPVRVNRAEIEERVHAPSSMPPMGSILSKREIRDVIAYLASLK